MKFFTSKLWLFAALFITIFSSCEKDDSLAPQEAVLSEAQTYEVMQDVLLEALENPTVREFIKEEALKTVTYDYEVVYGMVKDERMSDGTTLESAFLAAEGKLRADGQLNAGVVSTLIERVPLLSINVPVNAPNWETTDFVPPVIVDAEQQKKEGRIVAKYRNGVSTVLSAKDVPDYPVINIAQNERMIFEKGVYSLDYGLIMYAVPTHTPNGPKFIIPVDGDCLIINGEPICDFGDDPGPGNGGGGGGGNPSSCDGNYGVNVIMNRLRLNNLGSYEFLGRPELRLRVIGGAGEYLAQQGTGQVVVNYFTNPRRRDINNTWWSISDNLFVWSQTYGEIVHFDWKEEDGGAFRSDQDNFELTWAGDNYSITIPTFLKARDEDLGEYPVNLNSCNRTFGSSGGIQFRVSF